MPAGELRLGERVVRLDGTTATVVATQVRPGAADYYNLTVSVLHTFAVGVGQFVVHNCGDKVLNPKAIRFTQSTISNQGEGYTVRGNIQALKDGTLKPSDLDPIRVFRKTSNMTPWKKFKNGRLGLGRNLGNGKIYSLDNRRLYAYQQAGIKEIPVEWVDQSVVKNQVWKWTTKNFGRSIRLLE